MGVNTKSFDNASDMITFSRASGAYGLTKVSYGPELAPSFDIETNWTTVTGWTWAAGVWSYADTGLDYISASNTPIVAGKTYVATITFASAPAASGYIFALFNSSANENYLGSYADFTGSGTIYTKAFTASSSSAGVRFYGNAGGAAFSVSEISIKEVTYNSSDPSATLKLIYHPDNVPRIEYNVDGTAKGLLIEEARTNLLTYSEDFSNAAWVKTSSTVESNVIVAPDGTLTGDLFTNVSSPANYRLRQLFTNTASIDYTYTIYVKKGNEDIVQLSAYTSALVTNATLYYTFSTDAFSNVSGTTYYNAEKIGNGWIRLSMTFQPSTTSTNFWVRSGAGNGVANATLYIWGAQVEAGSFPTSYIKTTGATATRALDIPQINVSNFINKSAGTFLATFNYTDPTNVAPNYVLGGLSNARVFYNNSGTSAWYYFDGSAAITFGVLDSGEVYKLAVAIKTDSNISTAKNGDIVTTSTSGTTLMTNIEAYPTLAIGGGDASQKLNGHIKSITYYPRRLTDAQIQRLTQPISTPTLSLTFDGQATSFTEDSIHG